MLTGGLLSMPLFVVSGISGGSSMSYINQSSFPTTLISGYSRFPATPDINSFGQPSPAIVLSLPSPSIDSLQSDIHGVPGHGLNAYGNPPPFVTSPSPEPMSPFESCDGNIISEEENPSISKSQQKPRVPMMTLLLSILRDLQHFTFTVLDLLGCVIDGQGAFGGFWNTFFSPRLQDVLLQFLDKLSEDPKGHGILLDWMFPHSVVLVQERIHKEIEDAKPHLQMKTSEVTPSFIETWDIHHIMEPVTCDITSTLTSIIKSASESKAS